jgi:choline dehydrogenase-like flavoprotein
MYRTLGLSIKTVPQNTSGRPHHCGKCYTGCSSGIKNSTTNAWLKDAAFHGAKFLDLTRVSHVLIKNGKAVGVQCFIHGNQQSHTIYSKTVVVAGGALHTPSLLIKSGLTNSNIGKDFLLSALESITKKSIKLKDLYSQAFAIHLKTWKELTMGSKLNALPTV